MNESDVSLSGRAAAAFIEFREGNNQAMAEMIALVTPTLWQVVRGCGLSAATAEDVIQTTWLRLVEKVDTIQHPQALLSWLCVTARREAWRLAKAERVETPREEQEDLPEVTPHDPERLTLLDQRRRTLWNHLTGMSPRCQYLLRVIASGDRPDYSRLAESLNMPIGSIGPTRGRCLAALRRALNEDPAWSME